MRVLVVGASGLLGRSICSVFNAAGHEVTGTALSRVKGGLVKLDVTKPDEVKGVLAASKPEIVIYAVKERVADSEEALPADKCEAALASMAAQAAAAGAWVLYISSDDVFSGGKAGCFKPEDPPCPGGSEGALKVRLEAALAKATQGDCAVLRVPPLYGPLTKVGESRITMLAKLVFPRIKMGAKVDDWQRRFPTHTMDVASVCLCLAEGRSKNAATVRGTWHYSADTPLTDLQVVIIIADILQVDLNPGGKAALEADKGDWTRPQEVGLDTTSLTALCKDLGLEAPVGTPVDLGLAKVLTALIPAAAMKKNPSQIQTVASDRSTGDDPESDSDVVEIDTGSGKVRTSRKAANIMNEANNLMNDGKVEEALKKMREMVLEDPSLEVMDQDADRKCIEFVASMIRSKQVDAAEKVLTAYYAKKEAKVGPDSQGLLALIEAHVFLYKTKEDWPSMAEWAGKHLAFMRKFKGEGTLEVAVSLGNYALAIAPSGKLEEAEKCFNEALEIQQDKLGKESEHVAQTLHNLALLFRNSMQFSKAEEPYERSRQIWRKKESWGLLAVSCKDSAIMYDMAGNQDKAIAMLDKATHAIERLPDEIHGQVADQLGIAELRNRFLAGGCAAGIGEGDKKGK